MTAVLEHTESLLAPIIIHFIWNAVGAIILGGVSLADDYPSLINTTLSGNQLISGGIYKMEGSIVVLILNIVFTYLIIRMKRRKI
ncbi:MAG: amino terminal protease family [Anaerocolumna sp.]|nr:amino terminal protease family [Anaerocolumna sp.]